MAKVCIYLNFNNETEKAFEFYKTVFGTDYPNPPMRFGDMPAQEGAPEMPDDMKNLIMHTELPIMGEYSLMGSDAPESMGFKINQGNQVYIMLCPDTRKETKQLFDKLSEGGVIEQELQDMFWGDYYGSCRDKFGVQWMFDCDEKI